MEDPTTKKAEVVSMVDVVDGGSATAAAAAATADGDEPMHAAADPDAEVVTVDTALFDEPGMMPAYDSSLWSDDVWLMFGICCICRE